MALFITFVVLLILMTLLLGYVLIKAIPKKTKISFDLSSFIVASMALGLSYLIAVLVSNQTVKYVFCSMYFLFTNVALIFFATFIFRLCDIKRSKTMIVLTVLLIIYAWFDTIIFIINPFNHIVVSLINPEDIGRGIQVFDAKFTALGYMHILYSYILVVASVVPLVYKIFKVPNEYKKKYILLLAVFLTISVINSLFLFIGPLKLDISLLLYGFGAAYCYTIIFGYATKNLLKDFKSYIFETIEQGMIVFDYTGKFFLANEKAEEFLPTVVFDKDLKLADLSKLFGVDVEKYDNYALQLFTIINRNVRCNYSILKNKSFQKIGYLFTLVDETMETDILTGFHNFDGLKKSLVSDIKMFSYPLAICVMDINGLSIINSSMGHNKGDLIIKDLANIMKVTLPDDTYFVRGEDAILIALSQRLNAVEMNKYAQEVVNAFEESLQYAVNQSVCNESLIDDINDAVASMKNKKMLDKNSSHSSTLISLIKALEECDSDTKAHVKRTQEISRKLGERLGLSDIEQSNLSLLCSLHDIGKISIPQEIVNKPSKLTKYEWDIMKTHPEKGYQIAKSTKQLEGIALMIKYHHEKWDGTGYPDGLSKESIPLLSRVIAVVDSFDAMIHDKIYRKAMAIDDVKNEFIRCAGTQFDPAIVTEFLKLLEEDEDILVNNITETNNHSSDYTEDAEANVPTALGNIHPISYSRYLLDENSKIIEIDENFEELTGFSLNYILDHNMYQVDLIPEDDRQDYLVKVGSYLSKSDVAYLEHRLLKKDGTVIYVYCFGRVFFDQASKRKKSEIIIANVHETYVIGLMSKIEKEKNQVRLQQWENTYRRDSLTGLLNHIAFKSDIESILLKGEYKSLFIMLDVDKFKQYNDTFGHHAGDEFLITLSKAIAAQASENVLTCRMGGDEFAIYAFFETNVSNAQIKKQARDIFDAISKIINDTYGYSISMGAVISSNLKDYFLNLYENADKQLYNSKGNGRNTLTTVELQGEE